jgi:hypothetical protein
VATTLPDCNEKTAKLAVEIHQKILRAQVNVHRPTQSAVARAIFAHGPLHHRHRSVAIQGQTGLPNHARIGKHLLFLIGTLTLR